MNEFKDLKNDISDINKRLLFKEVKQSHTFNKDKQYTLDGLYDENIFGPSELWTENILFKDHRNAEKIIGNFGRIEFQIPMRAMNDSRIYDLENWFFMKSMLVLPPNYRSIVKLDDEKYKENILNKLYSRIIDVNKKLNIAIRYDDKENAKNKAVELQNVINLLGEKIREISEKLDVEDTENLWIYRKVLWPADIFDTEDEVKKKLENCLSMSHNFQEQNNYKNAKKYAWQVLTMCMEYKFYYGKENSEFAKIIHEAENLYYKS